MKLAENILSKNFPVLLESNYKEEYDSPLLLGVMRKTGSDCLQIVCGADGAVLVERFVQRESSRERSPFYFPGNVEEFIPKVRKGFDDPLKLPGEIIKVDTTDFSQVDLPGILKQIQAWIRS